MATVIDLSGSTALVTGAARESERRLPVRFTAPERTW